MSKLMKNYLLAFLLAFVSVEVVYAAATKFTDLQCTNLNVTGTLTNAGCSCTNTSFATTVTFTNGLTSSTGTFTGGSVSVSSATTSTDKLYFAGAFATLPTTGYNRGTLAVQTSDMKLYISTETVSVAGSWKSVGSQ